MATLLIATPVYFYVFGMLTVAGGVLGFVKAKSAPSLIAGSIAGGLLLLAAWLMQTQGRSGVLLGLLVSVLLLGRFGGAYAKSKKAMPALPMLVLGAVGVLLTVSIMIA